MLSQKPRHPIHSMKDSKPEWKAKPSSSWVERDLCCGSRACPSGSNGPWLKDTREGSWSPLTAATLCTGKGNLALLEGYSLNVSASRIHDRQQVIVWFPHFPLCKQAGLVWLLSLKLLTLSTLTVSWKKMRCPYFLQAGKFSWGLPEVPTFLPKDWCFKQTPLCCLPQWLWFEIVLITVQSTI